MALVSFGKPIKTRFGRPDELDEAARLEVGDIALCCLLCDAELHSDIAGLQSQPLTELVKKPALPFIERFVYRDIYRDIGVI